MASLPIGDNTCALQLNCFQGKFKCCIAQVDDKDIETVPYSFSRGPLVGNRRYKCTANIWVSKHPEDTTIQVFLNDELQFQWSGLASQLNARTWTVAKRRLGIGGWDADITFHSVKLRANTMRLPRR